VSWRNCWVRLPWKSWVRASTRVLKLEKSLKERMRKIRFTPIMTMIRTVRIKELINLSPPCENFLYHNPVGKCRGIKGGGGKQDKRLLNPTLYGLYLSMINMDYV
jgi:hypothetical protein